MMNSYLLSDSSGSDSSYSLSSDSDDFKEYLLRKKIEKLFMEKKLKEKHKEIVFKNKRFVKNDSFVNGRNSHRVINDTSIEKSSQNHEIKKTTCTNNDVINNYKTKSNCDNNKRRSDVDTDCAKISQNNCLSPTNLDRRVSLSTGELFAHNEPKNVCKTLTPIMSRRNKQSIKHPGKKEMKIENSIPLSCEEERIRFRSSSTGSNLRSSPNIRRKPIDITNTKLYKDIYADNLRLYSSVIAKQNASWGQVGREMDHLRRNKNKQKALSQVKSFRSSYSDTPLNFCHSSSQRSNMTGVQPDKTHLSYLGEVCAWKSVTEDINQPYGSQRCHSDISSLKKKKDQYKLQKGLYRSVSAELRAQPPYNQTNECNLQDESHIMCNKGKNKTYVQEKITRVLTQEAYQKDNLTRCSVCGLPQDKKTSCSQQDHYATCNKLLECSPSMLVIPENQKQQQNKVHKEPLKTDHPRFKAASARNQFVRKRLDSFDNTMTLARSFLSKARNDTALTQAMT